MTWGSPRILLVDDEPLVLEMFQTFLRSDGYDVLVACDVMSARWHIEHSEFEVFVCDVMLGDTPTGGLELMNLSKRLRPHAGIILITGNPNNGDRDMAENMGARYLSKPIGFDQLRGAIASLLAASHSEQLSKAG